MSTFMLAMGAIAVSAFPAVSAATQPLYAQCGGVSWTGGTVCASGSTCVAQNTYYSQCLPSSNQASSVVASKTSSTVRPPVSSTASAATRATSTSSARPATSSLASSGPTYKASFTHYGAGDTFGSPNCNTNTAACGFYTYPGYSAAVSQNVFGVGPGAGAGPACGTCWRLTGQTDSSGNKLSNAGTSIVVMVNNLCPANGNPLCSQSGLTGTNQYGANVNFDLCSDSGAQAAFFGNNGVGLAIGTATEVDCGQWKGSIVH